MNYYRQNINLVFIFIGVSCIFFSIGSLLFENTTDNQKLKDTEEQFPAYSSYIGIGLIVLGAGFCIIDHYFPDKPKE